MNRAQISDFEPTGAGWRWTVKQLRRPVTPIEKWQPGPVLDANRRGTEPQIRASYAIKLWKAIGNTPRPLTKPEWIDAAGLVDKIERHLAGSAIFNLLRGKWVREDNGLYSKEPQP